MGGPLDQHLAYLRLKSRRETTITQRRYAIHRLRRALGHDPLEATRAELTDWQYKLTLTPTGMCTEITHVAAYYQWAHEEGLIGSNPATRLIRPKKPKRLPRPMSEGNMGMALEYAPPDIRLMLILAAYVGLRAGELARLQRADLLDEPPVALIDGKGGKPRILALSSLVRDEIAAFVPRSRGPLFPRRDGRAGPNSASRISQICNTYLHDIGIADTLHSLRHRFATEFHRETSDLRLLMEVLGHSDPATTVGYVQYNNVKAAEAMERLAQRDLAK
jgi:integrase